MLLLRFLSLFFLFLVVLLIVRILDQRRWYDGRCFSAAFFLYFNLARIRAMATFVQECSVIVFFKIYYNPFFRGNRTPLAHPPVPPHPPAELASLLLCSFRLGIADDERAQSEKAYVVMSSFKDAKRAVRVGVLPWGPPGGEREKSPRGGNFITVPGHPLWDITTGDEVGGFVEMGRARGSVRSRGENRVPNVHPFNAHVELITRRDVKRNAGGGGKETCFFPAPCGVRCFPLHPSPVCC